MTENSAVWLTSADRLTAGEEDDVIVAHIVRERRDDAPEFDPVFVEEGAGLLREVVVGGLVVDCPPDTVNARRSTRGEVRGDGGRVCPIEQSSRQAVMLGERHR